MINETNDSDTLLQEIASKASLLRPVFSELCDSISRNLSSTTEPISEELLSIKNSIHSFLSSVTQYDNEVKNHTMMNKVTSEGKSLDSDLETLDNGMQEIFKTLERQMMHFKTIAVQIKNATSDINEVSEQIRILSFNASIESARAGKAGVGFRVIATEIKKLSIITEQNLIHINKILDDTDSFLFEVNNTFNINIKKQLDVLHNRRSALQEYFYNINAYFENFDRLYMSVNDVISDLSRRMTKIAPIIQLHEITSQEIGNLGMVSQSFCNSITSLYDRIGNTQELLQKECFQQEAKDTAEEIRKYLTTERELYALERGIKRSLPNIALDMKMNTNDIELY